MSEYVRVVSDTEAVPEMPLEPALVTGYEPDRFQKFAIEAIEKGENVLVTAKTGSGKTFVGEYQIAKSLSRGGRVFYTTPVKSLSNQKFHDLKKLFPEASVGIMTGDIKFCPNAQILVMTTEILRNLLFKKGTATEKVGVTSLVSLEGLDAVIFDEVHYINDPDRGHVWEETLMLLPPEVHLILLSATLSSPFGFAKWLGESKKVRVWLISTLWRAVPLEHCVRGIDGRLSVVMDGREQFHSEVYSGWLRERSGQALAHDKFQAKVKDARRGGYEGAVEGKVRPKKFEAEMNEVLDEFHRRKQLPAILFVFSRVGCERLAKKVTGDFLDSSDSAAVAHIWDFHLSRYKDSLEKSSQFYALRELAMRGIAYHHSGLLPFLKEILEILFSKGYIKVLFATETFAVGINMPTKTVIFTSLEKFTDGTVRPLRSAEYIQMAGRAGRRGKDEKGLVLYLPQQEPVVGVEAMRQLLTGRAASFQSRMSFHYDFVLKVLGSEKRTGGLSPGFSSLIENSYWWCLLHQNLGELRKKAEETAKAAELAVACVGGKENWEHCEMRRAIEEKIAQTVNARRKAAQREMTNWIEDHPPAKWTMIWERFVEAKRLSVEAAEAAAVCEEAQRSLDGGGEAAVPEIRRRIRLLQEFGYVTEDGELTTAGQLASEANEGHPILLTEFFQRLRKETTSLSLTDLLTVLAVFLGENEEKENNKHPSDLLVADCVKEELLKIGKDAVHGQSYDNDPEFWRLTTEWVEPIAAWVSEGQPPVSAIAAKYEIFEGNIQKALFKLLGLVEELRAMSSLTGSVELLEMLEGAQELILRDIVVAESLYLRI